jgi:hypothetical protein
VSRQAGPLFLCLWGLVLLGSACEHAITLRGQVEVAVEVQRQFSREAPGILVLGGGFGKGTISAQLLAVLCDAGDQPLVVPFHQEQFGCAAEGSVWFRLSRLAAADRDRLSCGTKQQDFDALVNGGRVTVPDSASQVVASTTVAIFPGKGGRCGSGEESIQAALR